MWRDAALVCGKDLRIEVSSKVSLNQVVPFAAVVLLLVGLALGPGRAGLRSAAPGMFWVAVLLSSLLAVQRAFAIESADHARDGLRLSGLDPAGIFLGKVLAVTLELVVLELVLFVLTLVLFEVPVHGIGLVAASLLPATFGLAAVGTIYGVLAIGSGVKETLLPLLCFPVAAPVLVAATKVFSSALGGGGGAGWLGLLAVFAVVYLALGTVVFGPLLEES